MENIREAGIALVLGISTAACRPNDVLKCFYWPPLLEKTEAEEEARSQQIYGGASASRTPLLVKIKDPRHAVVAKQERNPSFFSLLLPT